MHVHLWNEGIRRRIRFVKTIGVWLPIEKESFFRISWNARLCLRPCLRLGGRRLIALTVNADRRYDIIRTTWLQAVTNLPFIS